MGALGDGTDESRRVPVQMTNVINIASIAGGNGCSFVLKTDGTVWCCGNNWNGQLGDGTRERKLYPQQVAALLEMESVSAGVGHTLALGKKKIQPPQIGAVVKATDPFRLKIRGGNFHEDLTVFISGLLYPKWDEVSHKSANLIVLKKGEELKEAFAKGVTVPIVVLNGDGGYSTTTFKR